MTRTVCFCGEDGHNNDDNEAFDDEDNDDDDDELGEVRGLGRV